MFPGSFASSKGYAPTSITYKVTPQDHTSAICIHCTLFLKTIKPGVTILFKILNSNEIWKQNIQNPSSFYLPIILLPRQHLGSNVCRSSHSRLGLRMKQGRLPKLSDILSVKILLVGKLRIPQYKQLGSSI